MHFEGMFRVKPDSKLRLNNLDPEYESAETARQETEHFLEKLAHQQASSSDACLVSWMSVESA